MSKIKKLIKNPSQSLHDTLLKRLPVPIKTKEVISDTFIQHNLLRQSKHNKKSTIYIVGFGGWKTHMHSYFKEYNLVFFSRKISQQHFTKKYRWQILNSKETCKVFIWGYKVPTFVLEFLVKNNIKTNFVEDGFIRSVALGATRMPPLSLSMDSQAPYFDANKATDIENLLNNYDCSDKLIDRAENLIKLIINNKLSKYNHQKYIDILPIYGEKTKKRILVIGQVEDDASIIYGCNKQFSNNDLVKLAVQENPNAQIIYKVHPDVLNGYRDYQSNPNLVQDICQILTHDIPLANALETIDHVYTITSLSGLEALLRGIKVTTIGAPFYSNWGLTDDRQVISRRTRERTIEELIAICYIIYPHYFDSTTGDHVEVEDVARYIIKSKKTDFINNSFSKLHISTSEIPLGIYHHYKGNQYQVFCTARCSETKEIIVIYQALYGDYDLWTRPLKNFIENVTYEGIKQPRFKLIVEQ